MSRKSQSFSKMEYKCVDSEIGKNVYEYYHHGLEAEDMRRFEEHLFVCFKCQETTKEVDLIFKTLMENREEFLPLEENAVGGG